MTPSVDAGAFVTSILDNLRRAGVQNTKRAERLKFTRLDPYPGVWVQGVGEYGENGQTKTVAIAIGPEFGTVGPELIRDAAKEAVKIADLLVVCGFAFDPLAGEEASHPRPPDDPPGADEPRPRDGRRAAQEDRLRQPVHGLRRARHRRPRGGGTGGSRSRSAASTSTTRRPASCAHRRSTTSPPGSSTPTTTATPSSSATPTSPAPTTPTTSSAAP